VTQDEVRAAFVYEGDTGRLRKVLNARKPYPWRPGGSGKNYLLGSFKGATVYAHRLVWFYHYGWWPKMLDHVDGDPSNNRIENLRECSAAQNNYNSVVKTNNKCGFKGVLFIARLPYRPWQAYIRVNHRQIILGYFPSAEAASAAYAAGARKYAKEFARAD